MGLGHRETLEIWAKDSADPPSAWTQEGLLKSEAERVIRTALMALAAAQVPRRVGDAGRKQLAIDKKVSRKIGQTYLDVWTRLWQAKELEPTGLPAPRGDWRAVLAAAGKNETARRSGATVVWEDWMVEQLDWLPQHRAQIAAWCLSNANHRFGARRCDYIGVEIRGIERVRGLLL